MRKIAFALFLITSLSSCFLHKKTTKKTPSNTVSNGQAHHNNEEIKKDAAKSGVTYTTYTSDSYIQRFKTIAIQEMNAYGIPASITLAQGLFESASGNSDLARVANNHFGVKCGNSWTGKSYYKNDDQENECFRVYSNPEESYRDHSNFL
jgi:flagellum-specific peptidoglycan hydrolase FlgJ